MVVRRSRRILVKPSHPLVQFVLSFSGWAVIGCLLVAALTFLPWQIIPGLGLHIPIAGFASLHGKLVFAGFLGLALLMVVTHTGEATALWKPLLLGGASIGLLAYCIWSLTSGTQGTDTTTFNGVTTTSRVYVPPGAGMYAEGVLALLLIFVSAIAIRVSLNTRHEPNA